MNRLSHANHVALAACIVLMLAVSLHAQTVTPPYTGEVSGDGVFVRSGPNARSYAITQVNSGQTVRVVDERAGWLGIEPIAGCYSVISARYVTADARGKIGTVTGQNVHVFAAGMSQLKSKSFSSPQGRLDRGQRVRIIGRVYGDDRQVEYFVIKPPAGAKYWISGQYVRPATAEAPADSEATMTPVERPAAETTDTTETSDTEAETVAPTPPSSTPGLSLREEVELRRQLQTIETDLNAEIKKPVGERDLQAVLAKAKDIDVPADSRFRSQYDALVAYLNKEITQVQKYREAQRLVQAVLAGEELPPAAPAKPTDEPRRGYDLTGIVQESRLPPTIGGDQRFVIRDPGTDIVRGYATSSDAVDLTAYTGQVVGLRGRIAFDRTIAYDVLKATEISVIDPRGAATATQPPAETTSVTPPTPIAPIATAPADTGTTAPAAPSEPMAITDPAVADLLEPVELPAPPDAEAPSQPAEPTPLEAQLPPIEPAAPAIQPEPASVATATPPSEATQPETDEPAMQPVTAPPATEPDIPAPTAPEPPRPDIAVAPAQPDITPPGEPAVPAAPAPAETAAVEFPEPVAPTTPKEPAAPTTTPEPVAIPTTPEPQPTTVEPIATTPEPVTPDMPQPITPEPPAVATPAQPQETTPEPVAIPTTPEPQPTTVEPIATTPEPVTPAMPQPITPEPPAVATPAQPQETTPEPVAVTPEPAVTETPAEPQAVTIEPVTTPATPEPVAVTPEPTEPTELKTTPLEPVAVEAQPETPTTVVLDPGTPETDDEDDPEDLAGIRPVAVAPIDMSRQETVEVAIAERDDQTAQTGKQGDDADEDDAATPPRPAPPAVMPAPQHSSPMPTEVLVTPDGYEVEYD